MMPEKAIKAAVVAVLTGDAILAARLGGPRVYDAVPRGGETPYVAFGDMLTRENGTATDRGHLSEVTLVVWSRQAGTREAIEIGDRIAEVLDDATLVLAGHRCIACRLTASETRRIPDKDLTRMTLRLRIVTEVL